MAFLFAGAGLCLLVSIQALTKRFALVVNTITKFLTSLSVVIICTSITAFIQGIARADII